MANKKPTITWKLVDVKASDLIPNPDNPKKRNQKGFERLKKSLGKFGRVFDGIANSDLSLIDGHSRLELSDQDQILKIFMPSRKLTKKEVSEMNAFYDVAVAGETDFEMIFENIEEEVLIDWEFQTNSPDYSKKNKEIDVDGFEDIMTLSLKYTEKDYKKVNSFLLGLNESRENALMALINKYND